MGNEQKILELKLREATVREMEVVDISTKDIELKTSNKKSKKLVFHVQDDNSKRIFLISDAWVKISQYKKLVGLWCPPGLNGLSRYSNIGRMLKHYQLEDLRSFIGSKVSVTADKNDFLVIAACDLTLKLHP